MTINEYRNCVNGIVKVLKQKYTNLSVDESLHLANKIMDVVILELNVEQK